MDSEHTYPIREVSKITGVNPVTLRAWQRRYGLIKPARTESGHRLYSNADIHQIRQILNWLDKGVSIGQVKPLLKNPATETVTDNVQSIQNELMTLAQNLKLNQLEAYISETSKLYPAELWLRKIIEPWLKQLSMLQRPDQLIIEQSARRLLGSKIERMITIQTGPRIALLQVGNISSLDAQLARFELQSLECRCYDLGHSDPAQLSLISERLQVHAFIILLGSGLNANCFSAKQSRLPENCFYSGQLGLIYQSRLWLNAPYAESITQLVKQHEKAFALVQK
jgi:MerR family transcriptional regulator, light-induced transcriptional regulator